MISIYKIKNSKLACPVKIDNLNQASQTDLAPTSLEGSLKTTSEISKTLSGSGRFLLACTVFSSPGSSVVRTTWKSWVAIQWKKIHLEFWFEKPLEFRLEIPYTKKFKNGQLRHVT